MKSTSWLWATLACLALLVGLRQDFFHRSSMAREAAPLPQVAPLEVAADSTSPLAGFVAIGPPPAVPETAAQQVPAAATHVVRDTLGRDDSIYHALKRNGIPETQIFRLNRALKAVFNPNTQSRPRDHFRLLADTTGAIRRFEYSPHHRPGLTLLVEERDGRLRGSRLELPVERRLKAIEVRIEDNLSNALHAAGEGDQLTDLLADQIFGGVINFRRDPRQGDHIAVLFEKKYRHDRFIGYGRVLVARYTGGKVSQEAVWYEDPNGRGDYYDAAGNSLERPFRLLPLSFRRISSRFNNRRFHPILKKTVPHLGTDYAASTGTPVWATANGRVSFAGRKGGYGNMVEITHANGYRTRYAHLSRIAVRKGQRVQQKKMIGRVGATGRATGPHLHYELIKDGRHINPEWVNKKARGKPLDPAYRDAFVAHRQRLDTDLAARLQNAPQQPTVLAAGPPSP